jgi:hypothetical protein
MINNNNDVNNMVINAPPGPAQPTLARSMETNPRPTVNYPPSPRWCSWERKGITTKWKPKAIILHLKYERMPFLDEAETAEEIESEKQRKKTVR